jgi:hypothetical protein
MKTGGTVRESASTFITDQSTGIYSTEVGAVFKTAYIAEKGHLWNDRHEKGRDLLPRLSRRRVEKARRGPAHFWPHRRLQTECRVRCLDV